MGRKQRRVALESIPLPSAYAHGMRYEIGGVVQQQAVVVFSFSQVEDAELFIIGQHFSRIVSASQAYPGPSVAVGLFEGRNPRNNGDSGVFYFRTVFGRPACLPQNIANGLTRWHLRARLLVMTKGGVERKTALAPHKTRYKTVAPIRKLLGEALAIAV